MSDDSLNNPSKNERQRRRRKRASKNLEEFGDGANQSTSAPPSKGRGVALHDISNQKAPAPGQLKNPSSGNSNSLELSDERKTKSRRSRKRVPRQGTFILEPLYLV